MEYWFDNFPALRVMEKNITADYYNRIRLVILRERLPLHIKLNQFRGLQFILDNTAWVCINEFQNNIPMLAWTNFNITRRDSLTSAVQCELRLYHMHAGLMMGTVLDALVDTIDEYYNNWRLQHYPVSSLSEE